MYQKMFNIILHQYIPNISTYPLRMNTYLHFNVSSSLKRLSFLICYFRSFVGWEVHHHISKKQSLYPLMNYVGTVYDITEYFFKISLNKPYHLKIHPYPANKK